VIKKCKCGCGGIIRTNTKRTGPDYIHGHNKTIMSKEERIKASIRMKNKIWTKESKLKASLSHIGKKHSEETIKKRVIKLKGKTRTRAFKEMCSYIHKGKKCDLNTRIKMSLGKTKDLYFSGFKSKQFKRIRLSEEYKQCRTLVFERDNYTCQNINCKYCSNKRGSELHPHHIKSFAKNKDLRFDIDNGITYCKNYHLKSGLHKGDKNRENNS